VWGARRAMIGTEKRRRFKILFLAVASSTRHDERYFRQAMIGRWNFLLLDAARMRHQHTYACLTSHHVA
jgi:hypothetical protein